ncbi:MAG: TRAP transporter substrate-binding protein [Paracoccaceae bacterium]
MRIAAPLLAALTLALPASAQEVTLRLHHFLPAQSAVPAQILTPWAERVEAASDGRIEVQVFPAMQLGGAPPQLIDQVTSGVADIVWTVNGYTPGRFPRAEVFELPFLVTDPVAASAAYWDLAQSDMAETEFAALHLLGTWVHGPGVFHASDPIATPADLDGLRIRGASRIVTAMIEAAGAEAVGMPVPAVPEALSRGVIDGTTLPWEVTPSLRISELVEHHTEFEGAAPYVLTFVMAMDPATYDAMPPDLQAVIDAASGRDFSREAARIQAAADAPARAIAEEAGNEILTLSEADAAPWRELTEVVTADWIAAMEDAGIDGADLLARARAAMDDAAAASGG